nr:hypothetical protein [Pontibaca methylaminivorans]
MKEYFRHYGVPALSQKALNRLTEGSTYLDSRVDPRAPPMLDHLPNGAVVQPGLHGQTSFRKFWIGRNSIGQDVYELFVWHGIIVRRAASAGNRIKNR